MKLYVLALLLALALPALCAPNTKAGIDAKIREFGEMFGNLSLEQQARVLATVKEREGTLASASCANVFCNDPDCGKNVTQLIEAKGYPVEDHYALTPDGYWLSLQRIPHGRNNAGGARPVVFLQHGLEDASHTWVINSAQQSLGFILADEGYEVWLGNNRGNTYSKASEVYSPNQSGFWNFSWDEMASTDLPTMIEYALGYSGQEQLYYIGHSEGTIQGFAGFQNTTLASKVKLFVALAPVAYVGNIGSEFLKTLAFWHIDTALTALGVNSFLEQHCWLDTLLDAVCDVDDGYICQVAMCVGAGCNPSNMNASRYDVYMDLDPAGTSMQNINHWGQGIRRDDFCKYDFLTRHQNEKHYGQAHPPCYDLSKMAAPVALFAGGKDKLADPTDVARLLAELNPDMIKYSTSISYYEHMDFVWGMDANTVVYPQVIELLRQYA